MNMIPDEHVLPNSFEPVSSPVVSAPWSDILIEAGFVGAVFLVLALIVAASVGR
jgi:hypothetical protein